MATQDILKTKLSKEGNSLILKMFMEKVLKPIGIGDSKCKKATISGDILTNAIDVFSAVYASGGASVNNGQDDKIKSLAKMKILGAEFKTGAKLGGTLLAAIATKLSAAEGLKRKSTAIAKQFGKIVDVTFVFTEIDEDEEEVTEDTTSTESFVDVNDFGVLAGRLESIRSFFNESVEEVEKGLVEFRKDTANADAAAAVDAALQEKGTFTTLLNDLVTLTNANPANKTAILAAVIKVFDFFGAAGAKLKTAFTAVEADSKDVFSELLVVLKDAKATLQV